MKTKPNHRTSTLVAATTTSSMVVAAFVVVALTSLSVLPHALAFTTSTAVTTTPYYNNGHPAVVGSKPAAVTTTATTSLFGCYGNNNNNKDRFNRKRGITTTTATTSSSGSRRQRQRQRHRHRHRHHPMMINTIVSYRDHNLSIGDKEDLLDKVLDKMEKYQSKWDRKMTRKKKNRKAKKFILAVMGMGILSMLFPVAFFVGGIVVSIIPMVTIFTFGGLLSCIMPFVGPLLLFHVISKSLVTKDMDKDNDVIVVNSIDDDVDLRVLEQQHEREKELTETIRVCLNGWNESSDLLKEQQEIEKMLTFEGANLYNQAKAILSEASKKKYEKKEAEVQARKLLADRQDALERKKQVSKLVLEYQNQTQEMEDNVRKLSTQWKDLMNKKNKQEKNGRTTIIPIDVHDDWKNEEDPLLRKFREAGIDI